MATKGEMRGMDKLGVWDSHIHTTIYKYINNKYLLHSIGNYIKYLVKTCNRKESDKNIYV